VATGIAFPAHSALAMENARGIGMGTIMSVLLTVHSFGMTVCPIVFGLLADHFGIGSTFYAGGLLCALSTAVCYKLTHVPPTAASMEKAREPEAAVTE
jgi:fucose permease